MVTIKLQRIGKKHQPGYRVVVAEKRSKLGGPPIEDLGSWNPFTKAGTLRKERIHYWVSVGARPTATAHNILVGQGVISGKKIAIKIKKKKGPDAAPAAGAGA